jgi:hypothetical protein
VVNSSWTDSRIRIQGVFTLSLSKEKMHTKFNNVPNFTLASCPLCITNACV